MNITEKFLNEIINLPSKISEKEIEKAKLSFLDYLAVTFAGERYLKNKINVYLSEFAESGNFSPVSVEKQVSLKDSIFLNGLNAHALDFDDGTNQGIIHLGSPIFSVLLPLAQKYNISVKKFFEAAVIGYETSFTLASSVQPNLKNNGYHATGVCGVLGISLAVSYMLDYSYEEMYNAFCAACVSATGFLSVLDNGSELKCYNVAKAAVNGYLATQMGKMGFKGEKDPLGSDRGFLYMFTGKKDVVLNKILLDGTFAIEKTYTKPYAACRYCHPSIEAAINIKNLNSFDISNISKIEVETYLLAIRGHDHQHIDSVASAKMSIPFSVACALKYKRAGLNEFTEKSILDTDLTEIAEKVFVKENKTMSDNFPKYTQASVNIILKDGSTLYNMVDFPKGEPENPYSIEELQERFAQLLEYSGVTYEKSIQLFNSIIDNKYLTIRNLYTDVIGIKN